MEVIEYDTPQWIKDIMKYVYQGSPMQGQQFYISKTHSPMKPQTFSVSKNHSPMRAQQFGLVYHTGVYGRIPRPILAARAKLGLL